MRNVSINKRPRDSLTAQVLRDLSARIERGELSSGDKLPTERELMVEYRVSRTVVREAISSLRSSGRIDTQQGRGAFVLSPPFAIFENGFQCFDAGAQPRDLTRIQMNRPRELLFR